MRVKPARNLHPNKYVLLWKKRERERYKRRYSNILLTNPVKIWTLKQNPNETWKFQKAEMFAEGGGGAIHCAAYKLKVDEPYKK